MLKLDQRPSGIWRIRGTYHGVRVDKSARTRSKTEAERVKIAWEKKIFAEVHGLKPAEQRHTFADAAESWILSGGNSVLYHYFDNVVLALADVKLSNITQGLLSQHAVSLFPTQANSTVNRGFFALTSVILNHAADERMMPPIKVRHRKVKAKRVDWHTPEKLEALLAAAGDLEPLLTFIIGTGARTSEALRLEWRDVSPAGDRVTFWNTKNGRPRSVDLCPRALESLPPRGVGRVWKRSDGRPWAETKNGRFYGPKQALVRICKRNELGKIGLHSLRHSWASWQYAIEPDPLRLMARGGWSSLAMVQNYAHLATNDLAQEVKKYGWFQHQTGQYLGRDLPAVI